MSPCTWQPCPEKNGSEAYVTDYGLVIGGTINCNSFSPESGGQPAPGEPPWGWWAQHPASRAHAGTPNLAPREASPEAARAAVEQWFARHGGIR